MKAIYIETGNNKIEGIVFIYLDQFDIHVKVNQTDNNMIKISKCLSITYIPLKQKQNIENR